jgi:curved DNA-binding protein CbpA
MHEPANSAGRKGRYLSLYTKLGVSPNASTDAIRLAYQVLAEAFCPDGAYTDDAMHHDLSEIQRAAEILGNPRTRRRYDLGYIDDSGRPTEAGLAHARRIRTFGLSGLAAAGAMLLIMGFWPSSKLGNSGVQTASLQERATPAPAKAPPSTAQPAAAPAPALKAASEPPAANLAQHPQQAQPAPQIPSSQTASQSREQSGYLPPPDRPQSRVQRSYGSPAESRRRRYAQRLERRKRPEFAEQDPSNVWEQDIWFPHRSMRYDRDDAPAPSVSRSASCLACLAEGGECAGICP